MPPKRKPDGSNEEPSAKKQNVTQTTPPSTPKKVAPTPKKTPKKPDEEAEARRLETSTHKSKKTDQETTTPRFKIVRMKEAVEMISQIDFANHPPKKKTPQITEAVGHLTATDGKTELRPTVASSLAQGRATRGIASKPGDDEDYDDYEDEDDYEDDDDDYEDPTADNHSDASHSEGESDHEAEPPGLEGEADPAFVFRFRYYKKGKGGEATEKIAKIPRVVPFSPDLSHAWDKAHNNDFAYQLFTYQDAHSPQDGSATQFVYTGPFSSVNKMCVLKEVFIPVAELEKRLCGSKQERLDAYAQDWATFRSRGKASKDEKSEEPNDGSHLRVCNLQGQPKEEGGGGNLLSFEFLKRLFSGPNPDNIRDIPSFIFERWCTVAYVAAMEPKKAFDINSRFWSHADMEGMRYGLSPPPNMPKPSHDSWIKAMEAALLIRNTSHPSCRIERDESEISPQDTTGKAPGQDKGKTKSTSSSQAKDPTNAESSKAGSSKGTPTTTTSSAGESSTKNTAPLSTLTQKQAERESVCFLLDNNFEDYILWGQHPQGFYFVWIPKRHKDRMYVPGTPEKQKLPRAQFSTNKPDAITTNSKEKDLDDTGYQVTNEFCKTKTILHRRKLKLAEVSKRSGNQNQIMGDLSANDVARENEWKFTGKYAAEWLHKSAYSFGGVGNAEAPGSQQNARNLVFGTVECNTDMIIYESYLKRLTRYLGRDVAKRGPLDRPKWTPGPGADPSNKQVVLLTSTAPLGKKYYWLSESLSYTWVFTLDNTKQTTQHTFDLFSLRCPTTFEAELHVAFDELWMGNEREEGEEVQESPYWRDLHDWLAMQGTVQAKH